MRGLFPLVLVAAVVVLFSPFWLLGKSFVPGDFLDRLYPWKATTSPNQRLQNPEPFDVTVFFYPQDVQLNRELKAGRFPLWNPSLFAGHPWIASGQSAQLYPPRLLLHWLLPPGTARTLDLLIHMLASGLCMYWFLRQRGFEPPAAGMGGLVFMLNAFMATWMEFEHVLILGTYTALMLLAVDRRNPFLLALAGGLALHAGHMQFCLYLGPLVAAYALLRGKALLRLGAGAALAVALSFPVTLPLLQLQSLCQRAPLNLSDQAAPLWSYLPTLLNPDFWGHPTSLLVDRVPAHLIFSEFAAYFGFIPLLLALSCVGRSSRAMASRETFFWAGVAILALWAASATWPYAPLAGSLPVFSRLVPGRILILFVLAGSMLAAQGCQLLDLPRIRRWGLALAGLWVTLASGILLSRQALVPWLMQHLKLPPADTPGLAAELPGLVARSLLTDPQSWVPVAAVALLFLRPTRTALVLFTAVDLMLLAVSYNPTSANLFPSTPALQVVQGQPGRVDKFRAAFYNTLTPYGCQLVSGYESLFPLRYYRLLWTVQPRAPLPMRSLSLQSFDHPILDALNLTWLVALPGTPAPGPNWELVHQGDAMVYRNRRAQPRAWVVGRVWPCSTLDEALERLQSFNPALEATVEGQLEPVEPGPSKVVIQTYACNRVTLEAELEKPGLLVLADQDYPGWVARVDGQTRPIVIADGALRGVFLGPGVHQVEFLFQPAPFWLGLKLALAALAALALWAAAERFLAPRRAGPPASPD